MNKTNRNTSITATRETLKLLNKICWFYSYKKGAKFTLDETLRKMCEEEVTRIENIVKKEEKDGTR